MKKKEIQQLKTKPVEELKKMLSEQTENLWTLKQSLLNGKVKNVKEMRDVKKGIARLMTFVKQNNGTK
ncbi:MAG: 50S ribosomal protein L29 [bacterium]|nr:50S ribosomal protein L29 [bacterium]